MYKASNNLQTGLDHLDDAMGKRTKAIQRKQRSLESLNEADAKLILPVITEKDIFDDENEN